MWAACAFQSFILFVIKYNNSIVQLIFILKCNHLLVWKCWYFVHIIIYRVIDAIRPERFLSWKCCNVDIILFIKLKPSINRFWFGSNWFQFEFDVLTNFSYEIEVLINLTWNLVARQIVVSWNFVRSLSRRIILDEISLSRVIKLKLLMETFVYI